jgi:PD-(D/E)XK endonuclease
MIQSFVRRGVEQWLARRAQSRGVKLDTKLKGDIAEQAAILYAMKHGWGVLRPVGDRLPFDLVFAIGNALVKIQVKSASFDAPSGNYVVDNRRTKTNRRMMIRGVYSSEDFDFALVYIEDVDVFYVLPCDVFVGYGSEIHMVEADKRQRKPKSADFRDAWHLIPQWAVQGETPVRTPHKFGEAVGRVIPSEALEDVESERERVET